MDSRKLKILCRSDFFLLDAKKNGAGEEKMFVGKNHTIASLFWIKI